MLSPPPNSRVRIKTDTNAYSFNALFMSMRSKQEKVSMANRYVCASALNLGQRRALLYCQVSSGFAGQISETILPNIILHCHIFVFMWGIGKGILI